MSERESMSATLLRRIENPPQPTDGPDYHVERAFWLEGIRRDLAIVFDALEEIADVPGRSVTSIIARRALDGQR